MDKIVSFLTGNIFNIPFNETISLFSLLVGFIVFNLFLLYCYQMFGITVSISKIYYEFPSAENKFLWLHNTRWVFQYFMFACLILISLVAQTNIYYIVSLLFVLMTLNPSVNAGNIYFIPHIIGAVSAIVLAHVGLVLCYQLWWVEVVTLAMLLFIFIQSRKNDFVNEHKIYFIEVCSIEMLLNGFMFGIINQ